MPAKELKVGDKAPAFTLESDEGEKVSLKDLKGKTVVLYFYPKDDTPGCTQEACDFRDARPKLSRKGVVVLGVSKDTVEKHQRFKKKHGINFPLLADVDGEACEAYGVWQKKTLYGRKFMGIVRMTFVIGPDGKIAKVFPKVKVAGHVDEILAEL